MTQDSSDQDSSTLRFSPQRITRLTPLSAVLALIDALVTAVPPKILPPVAVEGQRLAADVAAAKFPPQAIALLDGFAVQAATIADATPYAAIPLQAPPRISAGDPMPHGTDAVLPLDAVIHDGGGAAAIASVAPGEGVLPAGGDAMPDTPLRRAGSRVRSLDIPAMSALGIGRVSIRVPRIGIGFAGTIGPFSVRAAVTMLVRNIFDAGGEVAGNAAPLDDALADGKIQAIVAAGGTGSGERDDAVVKLARCGRVEAHGIAISPGETTAFGFAGDRPVLLLPGRFDAALAAWCLIGRPLMAKLAGSTVDDLPLLLSLKRKVASAIGMTELIPVRCSDGMAEPLASGYLSLSALTQSDGFIVVPADSEGFAAGTQVAVTPWP